MTPSPSSGVAGAGPRAEAALRVVTLFAAYAAARDVSPALRALLDVWWNTFRTASRDRDTPPKDSDFLT